MRKQPRRKHSQNGLATSQYSAHAAARRTQARGERVLIQTGSLVSVVYLQLRLSEIRIRLRFNYLFFSGSSTQPPGSDCERDPVQGRISCSHKGMRRSKLASEFREYLQPVPLHQSPDNSRPLPSTRFGSCEPPSSGPRRSRGLHTWASISRISFTRSGLK